MKLKLIVNAKCALINARSVVNKICDLKGFLEDYCPDFTAITETWFESYMPNSMFVNPNRYWCYRKDRPTRGGGVCLFVKCSLNLVHRNYSA